MFRVRFILLIFFIIFGLINDLEAYYYNTYLKIDDQSINDYESIDSKICGIGGKLKHSFPPNEFICYIPEDKTDKLEELFNCEIETITTPNKINEKGRGYKIWNYLRNNYLNSAGLSEIPDSTLEKPNCGYKSIIVPDGCKAEITGPEAQFRVTNNFMIGKIAVAIILMESDGNSENWTTNEETIAIGEAVEAYDWLSNQADMRDVQLSWVYEIHTGVPTGYEPISTDYPDLFLFLPCTWEFGWINDALQYLNAGDNGWHGLFAYANRLRNTYQTNWAFCKTT